MLETTPARIACAALALAMAPRYARAQSAPVPEVAVTAQQVHDFFGGRKAKLVIGTAPDGSYDGSAYLVDFTQANPQPQLIRAGIAITHGDPLISPDGTRITYRGTDEAIWVCKADAGGSQATKLADKMYCPSWWIHPATRDEYIIYVNTQDRIATSMAGTTYIQKLVTGTCQPDGPAKVLVKDYAFRWGRSPDGRYIAENYPAWAVGELKPEAVEDAFVRFDFRGDRACSGSISQDDGYPQDMVWDYFGHTVTPVDIWEPRSLPRYPAPYTASQAHHWSTHPDVIVNCLLNNANQSSDDMNTSTNAVGAFSFNQYSWLVLARKSRGSSLWMERKPACATPVIAVNGKPMPKERNFTYSFMGSASVTIAASDGSKILWTDNDATPLSAWKEYTGAIAVDASKAISAVTVPADPSAKDNGGRVRLRLVKSPWFQGQVFGTPPFGETDSPMEGRVFANAFDDKPADQSSWWARKYDIDLSEEPKDTWERFVGLDAGAPVTLTHADLTPNPSNTGYTQDPDLKGGKLQGSNLAYNDGYEDIYTVTDDFSAGTLSADLHPAKAYRYYRFLTAPQLSLPQNHIPNGLGKLKLTFGSAPDTATVQAPTISPHGGAFAFPVQVTLSTATAGAAIHYTLDGTAPTAASPAYTAPISLAGPATVQALATKDGKASAADQAAFTAAATQVAPPALSPAPGSFQDSVTVTLTCPTAGASIRYTLDGTEPGPSAQAYSKPLVLRTTTLVKVRAYKDGLAKSSMAYGAYAKAAEKGNAAGKLVYPVGGEKFRVGDTLRIRWLTFDADAFDDAVVAASLDGGKNWSLLTTNNSVNVADSSWGRLDWVIGDALGGKSTLTTQARVRVQQYNGAIIQSLANDFTIQARGTSTAVRAAQARNFRVEAGARGATLALSGAGAPGAALEILSPEGRRLLSLRADDRGRAVLPTDLGRGLYLLKATGPGGGWVGLFALDH